MEENNSSARERILRAAFEEFSQKGYKQASTNAICNNADVSKGLIFHYFGNKRKLYGECVEMAMQLYYHEYLSIIDFTEPDMFERIKKTVANKIEFFRKNDSCAKFLFDFYRLIQEGEFSEFGKLLSEIVIDFRKEMIKGIDFSHLREGISKEQAFNFIINISMSYADAHFLNEKKYYVLDTQNLEGYLNDLDGIKDFIMYGIMKPQ